MWSIRPYEGLGLLSFCQREGHLRVYTVNYNCLSACRWCYSDIESRLEKAGIHYTSSRMPSIYNISIAIHVVAIGVHDMWCVQWGTPRSRGRDVTAGGTETQAVRRHVPSCGEPSPWHPSRCSSLVISPRSRITHRTFVYLQSRREASMLCRQVRDSGERRPRPTSCCADHARSLAATSQSTTTWERTAWRCWALTSRSRSHSLWSTPLPRPLAGRSWARAGARPCGAPVRARSVWARSSQSSSSPQDRRSAWTATSSSPSRFAARLSPFFSAEDSMPCVV